VNLALSVSSLPVTFDFSDAPLPIRADLQDALRREWSFLAAPGTWFSGAERVAIARAARDVMESSPPNGGRDRAVGGERTASRPIDILDQATTDVVRKVAADSPRITEEWVAALPGRGIDLPAYAEIIGIVARLSSVDFFHRALGLPLEALPEPEAGEPSRIPPPGGLVHGKSFLPMALRVSIPQTISLVPAETVAWQALSDATYMTFAEMDDPDFSRAMHRTQIELVAARTSQVNECFY
jgi:hypothetical protein